MNMARYDWGYKAEAEETLDGRALVCPRGKVIGGSSSINGMIYVRGNVGDYDHWQKQAPPAGLMQMCFPISAGWRHHMAARHHGAAQMAPFT